MNFILNKVNAREILDSRGNPTVEVEAFTADGEMARASSAIRCQHGLP